MSGYKRIAAFLIAAILLLGVSVHASEEASAEHDNAILYPNGLVIQNEEAFAAPDGKIVCMTVDSVLQDVEPGDYTGHEIVIWTLDEQTADIAGAGGAGGGSGEASGGGPAEPDNSNTYVSYRSALLIDNNEINENASALSAVQDAETLTAAEITGAKIDILGSRTNILWNEDGTKVEPVGNVPGNSDGVWDWVTDHDVGVYNGITITDSDVRIRDTSITYEGNGGDDFHMFGTAVGVAGASRVVLDNVDIRTHGVIATALSVSGTSDVLVRDSFILTKGTVNDTWYKYNEKGMTSAAWVLGGRGTVRSTNALGISTMTVISPSSTCSSRTTPGRRMRSACTMTISGPSPRSISARRKSSLSYPLGSIRQGDNCVQRRIFPRLYAERITTFPLANIPAKAKTIQIHRKSEEPVCGSLNTPPFVTE